MYQFFDINFGNKKSLDVAKLWRVEQQKDDSKTYYNIYYSIVSWFCKCKITLVIFRKLNY